MASEANIAQAASLILDRLEEVGYIAVENDRALHRKIEAGTLSINTVKRAMSRLVRTNRVKRISRPRPEERGMGAGKIVYCLRRSA